ncbi:MAG TPA: oligopeptide/dipeptide ABC transporter ATP-binding protein [Spirochaetota bacterium]|nr:oligopeptide/dipeptide ABC transporter ATP-binding protein [Spirochaetota bacterium]
MSSSIQIKNLKVFYPVRKGILRRIKGYIKAVNQVTLMIEPGQTYSLVGESGCGKSSLGKALVGLAPFTDGDFFIYNVDHKKLLHTNRRRAAAKIQMIFQDPYGSLNPKLKIGDSVAEGASVNNPGLTDRDLRRIAATYLEKVGLYAEDYDKYPFEFSGGQRQRIGIARALAARPDIIICDEVVSALDASVQASILNLLLDLQDEFKLTYIFISHDLSVVRFISHQISIMYLGEIVESGPAAAVLNKPAHPYTKSLLQAVPDPDAQQSKEYQPLAGDVPSPLNLPSGCFFAGRCPYKKEKCRAHPELSGLDNQHTVRCHFPFIHES